MPFILLILMAMISNAQVAFREHVVAEDLRGAYQVIAVDVNRDGRTDLIGLAQFTSELCWYENPTWERHVIAKGLTGPINLDFLDRGPSQPPLIVLASAFAMEPEKE